jgi:probable biosynthetic protein (TIGR04098 family)
MANVDAREIELSKAPGDYGLDSISLLIFRETCERQFGVYIPDVTWVSLRTLGELSQWLEKEVNGAEPLNGTQAGDAAPVAQSAAPAPARQRGFWAPDDLSEEIDIGMPFTGINNLSENALLKYLGDLRWRHLSDLMRVPSKQIIDEENNRVYATFFYVDLAFPEANPMASYKENDRLQVVSRIARFGGSLVDGATVLLPQGARAGAQPEIHGLQEAIAAGIPAAHLSNLFVQQFNGAEWLKKSRPANPGFQNVRELPVAPESYAAVKTAEKAGHFYLPDSSYVPLTEDAVCVDYKLIAERDVNGVGLVYFANYPVFLDICERETLLRGSRPIPEELCNRRTPLRRKSAYLNNASWKDTLRIETKVWIKNPFAGQGPAPEMEPIRLFSNQRMYRKSDGRLMMVSTAEKLIFGAAAEDLSFFAGLEALTTPQG